MITKEDIDKAAESYEDGLIYSSIKDQCDIQKAFKDGANWRINSIWHNAKEKPVKTGLFLVRFKENLFEQTEVEVWSIGNEAISSWEDYIEINWIVEYAYIEDLLPNKEDNI